jgi:hypothetical protein
MPRVRIVFFKPPYSSFLTCYDKALTKLLIGYVRTYIILPSTVWGIATGPLVDLGIQNPISIQIPLLSDVSVDRGQGGMVGAGKNLWANVNVDDSACFYRYHT